MKCPKCGYLGFEHVDRCRNCGYDFSLTRPIAVSDLPIRSETTVKPLDDLTLVDAWSSQQTHQSHQSKTELLDFDTELRRTLDREHQSAPAALHRGSELPLFAPARSDGAPVAPLAPLSVRRATMPVGGLGGARPRPQRLELEADPLETPPLERHVARVVGEPRDAGLGARLIAVAIDLLLLALVDAAVVYFTMAICGLALTDLDVLPKGPLLAFLLGQNSGYLIVFTAGGQTIGKMAAGIKVVASDSGSSLTLGQAFLRTLMWFILASPAGLGFLTALLSHDHRGLHDRFAGTRVVRASA
jgi:uncharacterized RDD family membrane protein YckC